MNGSCRSLWFSAKGRALAAHGVNGLLLAGLVACGGDQRSGAAPANTTLASPADTSAGMPDTAAALQRDTGSTAARPESVATRRDTAKGVAAQPTPRQAPVRKPAAPARPPRPDTSATDTSAQAAAPPQPARTDSNTAASQPAETTAAARSPTAEASTPLRDQYHSAPLDTVPQQVYDGWKQYNLNCARCHGEDVQGTTIAPHLLVSMKPAGPINTKELFVQTVCAGRPAKGMPAWCALGMEMPTIEAIYAYVKGRTDAKLHPGRPALKAGG